MTLIELIVAMVVIGVGLAGVLAAFGTVVASSADPMIRKQMLAIAEELMEEVTHKPFAAGGWAGAATPANRQFFDDVGDFAGYPGAAPAGIYDIDGSAVAALAGYNATVAVAAEAGAAWAGAGVVAVTIVVTVTHGGDTLVLTGWRSSY